MYNPLFYNDTIIPTPTLEIYTDIIEYLFSIGLDWQGPHKGKINPAWWAWFEEETCVVVRELHITFGRIDCYCYGCDNIVAADDVLDLNKYKEILKGFV